MPSLSHLGILVPKFKRKYSLRSYIVVVVFFFLSFRRNIEKGRILFCENKIFSLDTFFDTRAYFTFAYVASGAFLCFEKWVRHTSDALQSAIVVLVKFNSERTMRPIFPRNYEHVSSRKTDLSHRYARAFIEETGSKSAVERILFSEHTSRFVSLISRGCHPL